MQQNELWTSVMSYSFTTNKIMHVMSQSFPTGYTPPGNPGDNFFERANPGHPGNFFCLIPCPGAKNDGRIPREWGKIFPNQRNCSVLSLQKSLKKPLESL